MSPSRKTDLTQRKPGVRVLGLVVTCTTTC